MSLVHALSDEPEAVCRGHGGCASRDRWEAPPKCLEAMKVFPNLQGRTSESLEELLFQAVSRGDIRGKLFDAVVPKPHIKVYLTLYLHCANQIRNKLPSDLALSCDDLCALFDKSVGANQESRPDIKEHSGWPQDRSLADEVHHLQPPSDSPLPPISAANAARLLLSASRVSRAGNAETRARGLIRSFLDYFRPRPRPRQDPHEGLEREPLHLRIH